MMQYKRALLIVVLVCVFVLMTALLLGGAAIANEEGQSCAVPGGYATIQAAVNDPECDLVNVGNGIFGENVVISRTVSIHGQGPVTTVVDGGGSDHVFSIQARSEASQPVTVTVTLQGLSVVNGKAGIYNEAKYVGTEYARAKLYVNISDCAISGNSGSGIQNYPHQYGLTDVRIFDSTIAGNLGWGIHNAPGFFGNGILKVVDSAISDNLGGGIANWGCPRGYCDAALHLTGSTISGNSGSGLSNGIRTYATVTNSTISGNTADMGGGIINCGTVSLISSTITGNSAGIGGGIYVVGSDNPYSCWGFVESTHSIVANSGNGGDCILETEVILAPYFRDNGHNIVEDGSCITAASSRSGDPLLGPLIHNGGATLTHALLPGSPAIDAGDMAACPETDQRGYSRPADGNLDGPAECDIGSFELRHSLYFSQLPIIRSSG